MKKLLLALCALLLVLAGVAVARLPSPVERAEALTRRQVQTWSDVAARQATIDELRGFNPEWDFMWRTFTVLTLADRALAAPAEADALLPVIDSLIADTVAAEQAHGQRTFLMAYVDRAPWIDPSGRSVFVDGEVALMLGARRMVRDDAPALAAAHRERVAILAAQLKASPALLGESYPDEAWLFCNTNALVAMRMADVLDGSDHSELIARWVASADRRLREPATGLLGSEFTWDGRMMDGPEGSSIWLVAVNLLVLDPTLARDQYTRAKDALVGGALGLGWAREWGPGWEGPVDVDSGPIVPIIEASPSSSGFALMAARAFGDRPTARRLERALGAADLVILVDPRLAALADNAVGHAVLAHALTFGPLWAALGAPEVGG